MGPDPDATADVREELESAEKTTSMQIIANEVLEYLESGALESEW